MGWSMRGPAVLLGVAPLGPPIGDHLVLLGMMLSFYGAMF